MQPNKGRTTKNKTERERKKPSLCEMYNGNIELIIYLKKVMCGGAMNIKLIREKVFLKLSESAEGPFGLLIRIPMCVRFMVYLRGLSPAEFSRSWEQTRATCVCVCVQRTAGEKQGVFFNALRKADVVVVVVILPDARISHRYSPTPDTLYAHFGPKSFIYILLYEIHLINTQSLTHSRMCVVLSHLMYQCD